MLGPGDDALLHSQQISSRVYPKQPQLWGQAYVSICLSPSELAQRRA